MTSARADTPAPAALLAQAEAAQAAYDRADWAAAAQEFAPLLPTDPTSLLTPPEAVIAARYADALMQLKRLDDAELWIDRAIKDAPGGDPAASAAMWVTKGEIARFSYDFPSAIAAYQRADAVLSSSPSNPILFQTSVWIAELAATADPALALATMRKLGADPQITGRASKETLALIEDLEARAAANAGDLGTAAELADRAVADSGGLVFDHMTVVRLSARADAAIIARLRRFDDDTVKYLAYTGAGRLKDMSWITDRSGELPICGNSAADIRPDDSAVVTFAIGDDGRVLGALPVYASRLGNVGAEFAKAVSTWRWNPERIAKVDPFWRSTLQLQLRCVERPQPEQLRGGLWEEVSDWLRRRDLITASEDAFARKAKHLTISAADPRLETPAGVVLAAVGGPGFQEASRYQDLWRRLQEAKAPPAAFAILLERTAAARTDKWLSARNSARQQADRYAALIPQFQAAFPGDKLVDLLMLEEALRYEDAQEFRSAQPLLSKILTAGSPQLGPDDPIRRVAMLHQAIVLDRLGEKQDAARLFTQSGLTAEQCSLFDTHPVAVERSVSSEAYPIELLTARFGGYVEEAFDIKDDGHVGNIRTVVAYPPFLFNSASEGAIAHWKYIPPRLGETAVGCESQTVNIQYRVSH